MHRDDFVVTLRHENSNKTYREYRNEDVADSDTRQYRYREVRILYNSHYRFAFKNMRNVRRRIEITIDGSLVGDWIIPEGSRRAPHEAVVERFADTARKFKVVHPDAPDVADPGSSDNGLVVVKVWSEQRNTPMLLAKRPTPPSPQWPSANPLWLNTTPSSQIWTNSVLCGSATCDVHTASYSDTKSLADGCTATVEGTRSDQTFGTTVWQGSEGSPLIFEFKILGKGDVENSYSEETQTTDANLIRIELSSSRDMGKLRKDTKITLEQLGFKLSNTKKNGNVLIGYYDGPINILEQLKGVRDVEELLPT